MIDQKELRPIQIQPILDRLRTITIGDIKPQLDVDELPQSGDSFAGIVIANLPECGSVVAPDGQEYRFYAARVYPGKHVNPHFHTKGQEPYKILTGEQGIMHLGTVDGQTVAWSPAIPKKPGDEIIVQEGEAHSFENPGNAPVDFVFACPDGHLNEQDRFFTMGYQNGLPQYKGQA